MCACFQSKSATTIILFYFILFSTKASAINKLERIDLEEKTLTQRLIEENVAISKWLLSKAEGIDLFLVDKQLQAGRNETNIKVENATYSIAGEGVTNQTSLSINPRLPNLEKYWNLKFTTYDEQQDDRGANKSNLRQTPREQNYGATVGLFRNFDKIRVAFQPRIELQDPLNVAHSLAFDTVANLKDFRINPKLEFFANAKNGTGVFQALNFNFILNNIFSLTFLNEGTYEEKLHRLSLTNGLALGQMISPTNSLNYSFYMFSNNRDNYHLASYSLSTSWYHIIFKKILDFQLTPHLDFTNLRDFKGQAGITMQFTLNF